MLLPVGEVVFGIDCGEISFKSLTLVFGLVVICRCFSPVTTELKITTVELWRDIFLSANVDCVILSTVKIGPLFAVCCNGLRRVELID